MLEINRLTIDIIAKTLRETTNRLHNHIISCKILILNENVTVGNVSNHCVYLHSPHLYKLNTLTQCEPNNANIVPASQTVGHYRPTLGKIIVGSDTLGFVFTQIHNTA